LGTLGNRRIPFLCRIAKGNEQFFRIIIYTFLRIEKQTTTNSFGPLESIGGKLEPPQA